MELYRKELKLAVIKGLDESRGSSNVPIKLTHDTSDEYINYTEQIHVRYLFDNQVKEEILPTNDNGFYIPGKPLSHNGPIELAVHLINGNVELVTNELSFIVNNAPNGTTQVDPSEFTWQQLVDQYVNAKLDTFANKSDLSKFEGKVNGSIENQNQNIESFTSIQNSKITTLEGRMDTFTSLKEGSTTGDAELQDIRVGSNGITYSNAGDAVRGQYSQLKEDIGDLDDAVFNVIQELKDYTSNATILHNKFVSLFTSVDNKVLIAIRDDEEKVRDCYAISVSENDRFQVKGFIPHNGELHLPLIVMSSASLEKNNIDVKSLVTAENGNYSYWGNGNGIYEFVIPHGVKTLFVNKLDRTSEFLLKKYVDVKKSKIPTKISELVDDTLIPNEIERIKTKINEINDDHLLSKNEIVDARTGYDGTAYDTLGTAIRTQVSELKEELVDEITNRNTAINNAVTTERNRAISIENTKISKPSTEDNNKFARAKNGNVEWVEHGLPTDEQTGNAVRNWLDEHPEATTTVQNNTLDIEKMTSEMQKLARNFSDSVRKPLVSFTSDDGSINGDINIMGAILRRHNVPATCAVITGDGLSEEEKNAYLDMQNNYGWEIASHSIDSTLLGTLSESDCERYLKKSKKILVDAGFNVNGVVYPSGSANQNVRRLAKKYYQYGCNYNDRVNEDLFLDSFSISRIPLGAFYTNASHNTLEYYKSCVDKAVESIGWCVFCLHPYKEDFDETQQRYLEELIEYIESLNVEMVTLSKGYEVFGNIIEAGKSFNESTEDEFERFVVTNDGRTNLPIFYAKGSSVLSSMIPTDFRDRCITICNVSRYIDETYPDSASGIIVTMRCGDIFLQLWFPSNSNRIYRRTSTSKTSSGTFSLITPIISKTGINNYSATQAVDAYPSEQITVTEVTNGNSLGFPTKEGTLITKKLPNYTSQMFIPAIADDEIYMRRWDTTAKAWTQFINVLRNKIGNTYTYFGVISTIWKNIPTNIVNGLYIKSLKSIAGRTLDVPKPYFTIAELSTDKENPTVIASSDGYSLKLQAYIDNKGQLFFKYSEVGNNYVGLLEVVYN